MWIDPRESVSSAETHCEPYAFNKFFAMTMRWISLVPSPMVQSFESRRDWSILPDSLIPVLYSKLLLVILTLGLAAGLVGQSQQGGSLSEAWRLRAEGFTAKAIDSASQLKSLDKALVYAQLADIWWPLDRDKAALYYEKAVDRIFFLSSDEIKTDKNAFVEMSGKILVLISNRNAKQSKRLVSIIKDAGDRSDANDKLNADALVGFAKALVKDDPALAAEMGILALQMGEPSAIYELYWSLCRRDRRFSTRLFDSMLRSAAAKPTISIANSIKLAAFPELTIPNAPDEIRSIAEQKTQALEFLFSYLVEQSNKYDRKQIETCANDAYLVYPLLSQFAALLPAKQGIARSTIDHCITGRPSSASSRPDSQLDDPADITVESLLRLAEKESDPARRAYYLFRAASLANDQEKFEQAIKILESMSEAEVKSDRDFWDSLRYTVAANLAYKKVEEADYAGAVSVLDKVPDSIRTFARIGFGLKCSSTELPVQQFCADQLDAGVLELPRSTKGIAEKTSFGMSAVGGLAKFGHPSEALQGLETIVKLANDDYSKTTERNPVKKEQMFHIGQEVFASAIEADFLALYDQSITSSIANLADPQSKVNGLISLARIAVGRATKAEKGHDPPS